MVGSQDLQGAYFVLESMQEGDTTFSDRNMGSFRGLRLCWFWWLLTVVKGYRPACRVLLRDIYSARTFQMFSCLRHGDTILEPGNPQP